MKRFFAVTFSAAWLVWIAATVLYRTNAFGTEVYRALLNLGAYAPSVAGIVAVASEHKAQGVRALFKSLGKLPKGKGTRPVMLLAAPASLALAVGLMLLMGNALPRTSYPEWFIVPAFLYMAVLGGPLGAELGWRGFLLPRLIEGFGPFKAALIAGALWTFWKLPQFFFEGTLFYRLTEYFGVTLAFFGFMLYALCVSVLITIVYTQGNGSLLGAIIAHTMCNLAPGYLPLARSKAGALSYLLCFVAVSAAILYKYRDRLGIAPSGRRSLHDLDKER
ncbi:MAG: CPBP family intramembrane glutamic endopeptidase [Bacillota bacterium]